MSKEIKNAIAVLTNAKETWVRRRDAVDFLGEVAHRALAALKRHLKDSDVDVQLAVEKALERVDAKGEAPPETYSLQVLVHACEKKGARTVTKHEDGFVVDVRLREGRHQRVYVTPFERKDGVRLVRVFTYCGEADPDSLRWALLANMKLTHGALALAKEEGEERFVLVDSYLADSVTPPQVKAAVKEIAFYGDWVEKIITRLDDF